MKERGLRSSCPFRALMLGVLTLLRRRRPLVSEFYEGRQFVGMDLHRRRSMLVRMTEFGEHLETVRILNDRDSLAEVMSRAGESPEVVLEATYGWYWAVDALAELGATVHLAHSLGVKAFSYRRVKNDQRDAFDLANFAADGAFAARVDRAAGNARTTGAGTAQGQTGRDAIPMQGPRSRGFGQGRDLGADDRPVRCGGKPAVGQGHDARAVPGADRVAAPVHRRVRRGDRPVHRSGAASAEP